MSTAKVSSSVKSIKCKNGLEKCEDDVDVELRVSKSMKDSISSVKYVPDSNDSYIVVSSWDGSCRMYDTEVNWLKYWTKGRHPILGCVATDCKNIYYGGLDDQLCWASFASDNTPNQEKVIGSHDDAICCVDYSKANQILLTGSWDSCVKMWDPRTQKNISQLSQNNQVFCMKVLDELLVVATAGRMINVWDLRNIGRPMVVRKTAQSNYQSRCIDLFSDKKKYVVGSVEGRTSIEHINSSDRTRDFAFKAHFDKSSGTAHPVNAVRTMEGSPSLVATAGSDGKVRIWDINDRHFIRHYQYNNEVAALDYSTSRKTMAIGLSYLYDRDPQPTIIPSQNVYLRNLKCIECK